jgi:hypothetical protein
LSLSHASEETPYPIQPIPSLLYLIANLPPVNEKELFNQSLLREPRDCDKADITP